MACRRRGAQLRQPPSRARADSPAALGPRRRQCPVTVRLLCRPSNVNVRHNGGVELFGQGHRRRRQPLASTSISRIHIKLPRISRSRELSCFIAILLISLATKPAGHGELRRKHEASTRRLAPVLTNTPRNRRSCALPVLVGASPSWRRSGMASGHALQLSRLFFSHALLS